MNIATYALRDAFVGDCEACVIVSNDSDLVEPVRIIRQELRMVVGVLCPHQRASRDLTQAATFIKRIRVGPLRASQFADEIVDVEGRIIRKPAGW